ncbi:unnamed protein product [Ectocarpus sp. CCAP 1310/34]|nr:unnamed protein product [Ectocarpus sp. CCAP 1310/34]
MPCADGELCHQPDKTPQAPHGHVCHGGCGGRLHGNCGSMVGDIETRRICCSCVARAGKRKEIPAEGAEGAGAGPSQRPTKKKFLPATMRKMKRKMAVAVRTRGASAVLYRLIVSCHLTSASWNRQQMRVAMETRRSICRKQKWR